MWSLTGCAAQLHSPAVQARLDLDRPHAGLTAVSVRFSAESSWTTPVGQLLQVHLAGAGPGPHHLLDSYVRAADLVATYAPHGVGDVQSQIYWRSLEYPTMRAWGVELIVSVQTELLDSDPTSATLTRLVAEDIWTVRRADEWERCERAVRVPQECAGPGSHGLFLFRLAGIPASYLEMAHPSDLVQATVTVADPVGPGSESRMQLFPDSLEKGVIRRGRVRGLFLPRANDLATATLLYREFVASAPPLTA